MEQLSPIRFINKYFPRNKPKTSIESPPIPKQKVIDFKDHIRQNTVLDSEIRLNSMLSQTELSPAKKTAPFVKKQSSLIETILESANRGIKTVFQPINKETKLAKQSLMVFSRSSPWRKRAVALSSSTGFQSFEVVCILLHVLLWVMRYEYSLPNKIVFNWISACFALVYCFLSLIRIVSYGLSDSVSGFLADKYNVIDSIQLVSLLLNLYFESIWLFLFIFLKPIKILAYIKSISKLFRLLKTSMRNLVGISIFLLIFLLFFGVIGLIIWEGSLLYSCSLDETPSGGALRQLNPTNPLLCSRLMSCPGKTHCVSLENFYFQGKYFINPAGEPYFNYSLSENLNGMNNFDNILFSLFTLFQALTLKKWVDISVLFQRVSGWYLSYSFFLLFVTFMKYFVINFSIGVMIQVYTEEITDTPLNKAERLIEQEKEQKRQEKQSKYEYIQLFKARRELKIMTGNQIFAYFKDFSLFESIRPIRKYHKNSKIAFFCFYLLHQPIYNLTINLIILANSICLAMEREGQPEGEKHIFQKLNEIFVFVFSFEILLKMVGEGVKGFFQKKENSFDLLIVVISLVEVGLAENSSFSAMRALRAFRILKFLTKFKSIEVNIISVGEALKNIGSYIVLIVVSILIFALTGTCVYGGKIEGGLNFDTFSDSLLTIFTLFVGDGWPDIFALCINSSVPKTFTYLYFLLIMCFLHIAFLNMLIAFFATSFQNSREKYNEDTFLKEIISESNKTKGIRSLSFNENIGNLAENTIKRRESDFSFCKNRGEMDSKSCFEIRQNEKKEVKNKTSLDNSGFISLIQMKQKTLNSTVILKESQSAPISGSSLKEIIQKFKFKLVMKIIAIVNCFTVFTLSPFDNEDSVWTGIDKYTYPFFLAAYLIEMVIKIRMENLLKNTESDITDQNSFKSSVKRHVSNKIDLIKCKRLEIFNEKLKIEGKKKAYLKNTHNLIDIILNTCMIINLFWLYNNDSVSNSINLNLAIKVLTPLRLIRRSKQMQKIAQFVFKSIYDLISVALILVIILVVFAIFAVNLFKSDVGTCSEDTNSRQTCLELGGEWKRSLFSFSNVFEAVAVFLEMMTTDNWSYYMLNTAENAGKLASLLFVIFMIMCSLILLNIVVSLVIDSFIELESNEDGTSFLTSRQQRWVNLIYEFLRYRPKINLTLRKANYIRKRVSRFYLRNSEAIETLVNFSIITEGMFFAFSYDRIALTLIIFQERIIYAVSLFYLFEMAIKIISLGSLVFRERKAMFDLIAIIFHLGGCLLLIAVKKVNQLETTDIEFGFYLKVAKILAFLRFVRIISIFESSKKILNSAFWVFPCLVPIATVIAINMVSFGAIGIRLFGLVKQDGAILTEQLNFENFKNAQNILLRCFTLDGCTAVIRQLSQSVPGCLEQQSFEEYVQNGPQLCGNTLQSYSFFLCFIGFNSFVIMNLFLAIVVRTFINFSHPLPFHGENFQAFYDLWSIYDKQNTSTVTPEQFILLLLRLYKPMGIHSKKLMSKIALAVAKANKRSARLVVGSTETGNQVDLRSAMDISSKVDLKLTAEGKVHLVDAVVYISKTIILGEKGNPSLLKIDHKHFKKRFEEKLLDFSKGRRKSNETLERHFAKRLIGSFFFTWKKKKTFIAQAILQLKRRSTIKQRKNSKTLVMSHRNNTPRRSKFKAAA